MATGKGVEKNSEVAICLCQEHDEGEGWQSCHLCMCFVAFHGGWRNISKNLGILLAGFSNIYSC